jgi:hypothetical protein
VDSGGNVVVTGQSLGSGGLYEFATIKYSGAGVQLWTRRYHGPSSSDDLPAAIAVDSSGNVFVTGSSPGTAGNNDYATVAYSGTGVSLWTRRYNGADNGDDNPAGVAVDRAGNVFVTGWSAIDNRDDYVTIKYSSSIPAPHLDFQTLNNQLVLSWTNANFTLQSAPGLSATFTNLPGATSPYTNPTTASQQFFRLKLN